MSAPPPYSIYDWLSGPPDAVRDFPRSLARNSNSLWSDILHPDNDQFFPTSDDLDPLTNNVNRLSQQQAEETVTPQAESESGFNHDLNPSELNQANNDGEEGGMEMEDMNAAAEATESATEPVAEAVGSGLPEIAGAMPEALPFIVAHQLQTSIGDSINNNLYQNDLTNIQQQYLQNQQNAGPLGRATVNNVRDWNTQQANNVKADTSLGNQFGFLGTALGRVLGEASTSSIPQSALNTAYSEYGRFDPTSDGVSNTLDAASLNPNDMTNGEQTSESSSAIDTNPQ